MKPSCLIIKRCDLRVRTEIMKTEGGDVGKDLEKDSCVVNRSRKRWSGTKEEVARHTSKGL